MTKYKLISHKIIDKKDVESLNEINILYFYEDDDGDGVFYYKTPDGFEIYYYEKYTLSSFIGNFPELEKAMQIEWNDDKTSYIGYDGNYKCIYAGHGATLCINKQIYDDYVDYYKKHNKIDYNGFVDAYNTFENMCVDIMNKKEV